MSTLPHESALDAVLAERPTLRQSLLGAADNCMLGGLFSILHEQGWSSHAQARGIVFHRFAAEVLRTLKREGERQMPTEEGMVILREALAQRDVPPEDVVRVPSREQRDLRIDALKFLTDWEWDPRIVMDVERRLFATVRYEAEDGREIERTLTGQLDVLLADPPDGAIVCDWKTGWYVPPETPEDRPDADADHLSYRGWFQQRFYGWLVLRNFPAVQTVTFREVYPRRGEVRNATLRRTDLEHVEHELADLAFQLDRALAGGTDPKTNPLWRPSPGRHCSWCSKPAACPIEREARGRGAVTDEEAAKRYAAEFVVADRVRKHRAEALKAWVDVFGPVEVKSSKGRYVMGWKETDRGRRFGVYVPEESDRGPEPADLTADLLASAEDSAGSLPT